MSRKRKTDLTTALYTLDEVPSYCVYEAEKYTRVAATIRKMTPDCINEARYAEGRASAMTDIAECIREGKRRAA